MTKLAFELPEGIADAVHLTPDELSGHIRLMAALKMFELGKVSSGTAAQLANMTRVEFLETCSSYGVSPFNYRPDDVGAELASDLRVAETSP